MEDQAKVAPEELLYRRMSLRTNPPWFSAERDPAVIQQAFMPRKKDEQDGLSMIRASQRSALDAALPPESRHRSYVLAVVRAEDLEALGVHIDITPDGMDIERGTSAHVSIREMNSAQYRDPQVRDWARHIAENLVREICDPLHALPSASGSM